MVRSLLIPRAIVLAVVGAVRFAVNVLSVFAVGEFFPLLVGHVGSRFSLQPAYSLVVLAIGVGLAELPVEFVAEFTALFGRCEFFRRRSREFLFLGRLRERQLLLTLGLLPCDLRVEHRYANLVILVLLEQQVNAIKFRVDLDLEVDTSQTARNSAQFDISNA